MVTMSVTRRLFGELIEDLFSRNLPERPVFVYADLAAITEKIHPQFSASHSDHTWLTQQRDHSNEVLTKCTTFLHISSRSLRVLAG